MTAEWKNEPAAKLVRQVTSRLPRIRGAGKVTSKVVDLFPAEQSTIRDTALDNSLRLYVDVSQKYERSMYFSPHLYEYRNVNLLRRHLQPGNTFVDVGANIGLFTLLAAQVVGPQGKVVAIEPDPDTFARLDMNIRINHLAQVSLVEQAVSDTPGRMQLYRDIGGNSGANSLSAVASNSTIPIDVHVNTLDNILNEAGVGHVDLLKIDIEGWEVRALRESQVLQQQPRPVILIEAKDRLLRAADSSLNELEELFRQFGYQGRKVGHRDRVYS